MHRRVLLSLIGAGLLAAATSACTSFTPVYGDASAAGLAAARFNFAPPTNRAEQLILNRLQVAFPNPAGPSDPTLTVRATTVSTSGPLSNAVAVASPVGTRVEATVTIAMGTETVFSATRFTDTAYQGGKLAPTDALSAIGANETAARSTAESLRAAILAGYRPGMMVSTPRR